MVEAKRGLKGAREKCCCHREDAELLLDERLFLGKCQVENPWQTKVTIPPKSNLVNQWNFTGLTKKSIGVRGYLQQQGWLKSRHITKELSSIWGVIPRSCMSGALWKTCNLYSVAWLFSHFPQQLLQVPNFSWILKVSESLDRWSLFFSRVLWVYSSL